MTELPPPPRLPPIATAAPAPAKSSSFETVSLPSEQELNALLSLPNYTAANYLNHALSNLTKLPTDSHGSGGDEEEQRIMAELALQLQVQTQSCHDEIGRIGAELRAILPRCAADLGRVHVGIENMKDDAQNLLEAHLKSSLSNVVVSEEEEDKENRNQQNDNDAPTAAPEETMTPLETLETLSTLHALQQNLSLTKEILLAASTYNNTLQKIPGLLTPTTLNQGVQALIALENGARALSGMPGKSQRNEEIANIRNQILTLLKPVLLHALNKMESRLGPLQTCVGMYQSLNKMESLMEEYVKSRPAAIHKLWFDFRKSSSKKQLGSDEKDGMDGNEVDDLEFYDENTAKTDTTEKNLNVVENDPGSAFVEWLPTWYEAILVLLSEERRRAHAVFGADLAPEIIVKVLNECFRPILSSFNSRLSAICPADLALISGRGSGSFEAVCMAFESTLQFLSVAYEQIVDFDSSLTSNAEESKVGEDAVDRSTPTRTKTPVQLHMIARSIFVAIASPFAPYQANFAQLEENHSGMAARMVSSDIHSAVGERIVTLSSFQDSVERLSGLASFIFPLAQGAVARFESLNSGFRVQEALDSVDSLLSRHIGELSISFDTLSTNVLSENSEFTDNFDEQQVQCALEVLKIAGSVRRTLLGFEDKSRDRLRVLAGRMEATIDQESALTEAVVNNSTSAALVPDSLSAVEIETILATSVCGEDKDKDGANAAPSVLTLQNLSNTDTAVGEVSSLYPKSLDSLERLVKSCQSFVFDICSALPFKCLSEMASLPIWNQQESMWSTTSADSYGTLPQSYITQIGEHMLALVQALEPFASDEDALMLANMAMEGVNHVADKNWRGFAHSIDCSDYDDSEFVSLLKKGEVMKGYVLNYLDNAFEDEDDNEAEDDSAAQKFCNQWLDAVCSAITGFLLEQTMRIPQLSRKGCDHLSTDCNYIVNVLTALGVSDHPHPLLSHISELTKMSAESLQTRILESQDDGFGVRSTEAKIALMRGISI